jgi:hypothetical protein
MKKIYAIFFMVLFILPSLINAQTAITADNIATFNAYQGESPDPTIPYYRGLGVRRVIVADANGDGEQEIIATDYTNGGRVHVLKITSEGVLEIIWSSPVSTTGSGSTPRFPQVGDCDGDGNPEIIFEQNGEARICLYEWDGTSWGTEPAFEINSTMFKAAGALEDLRFNREVLTVLDFDGDGRSEIIAHGATPSRDVYIMGVEGEFPGFASVVIEGGHPDETPNARNWVGGSFWSSTPADINGDGKLEIINHHWDNFGMWAIKVDGPDSYTYPDTSKPGVYHKYAATDALSYFGLAAVDVDGDGKQEIAGTMYQSNFDMVLFQFSEDDTTANLFNGDPDSIANRFGIIAKKEDLAALAGRTAAEFWPCVKGDVNQDGIDEIYTGGGNGLNLIAVQYKGTGSLLEKENYSANLVYGGEGQDIFATLKIYHGKIDTVIAGEDTTFIFDPNVVDTLREETPFTAYIFADSVDLDGDGNLEIVIAEQSVYDSTTIIHYVWVDTTRSWERDLEASTKIINTYRRTIRVLEYNGPTVGFTDEKYQVVTPDDYILEQNYPNPFNPTTAIKFSLPVQKKVSLKVFDMLGREVVTLIDGQIYDKGNFEVTWNGRNNYGSMVASGNYIAELTYGNFSKSIKMTLLK